jgi:CRISPR-associated protein Csd1
MALPKRNVRLTGDTTIVYWADWMPGTSDPIAEGCDPIAALGPNELAEQPTALLTAPWRGTAPHFDDSPCLHVLTLTRVKSRVIVRAPVLTTIGKVADAVQTFFKETRICPRFAGERVRYGVRFLSEATISKEVTSAKVDPKLATQLLLCAIDKYRPYPLSALAAVIRRIRANDNEGVSTRRVALIKAVLERTRRLNSDITIKEFPVSLDEARPESAYQLGRLLALLEWIQADAIDDINATILDRHMGAVMATPSLVLPKLLKLSHHHISKISKSRTGAAVNHSKRLDKIIDRIAAFPARLELAEQGLLLIGYHHERTARFSKKSSTTPTPTEDAQ